MNPSDLLNFFKFVQRHSFTVIHNGNRILNQKLLISIGSHNSFSIHATSFNIALEKDCWRIEDEADNIKLVNIHNDYEIYFLKET